MIHDHSHATPLATSTHSSQCVSVIDINVYFTRCKQHWSRSTSCFSL